MGIEVELPDGRVIEVETDSPEAAARAAHMYAQRNPAPRGRGQALERQRRLINQGAPLGRRARTFNETIDQIPANLGVADELDAGAAWLGQGAMNLGRRALGRPIEISQQAAAEAAAQARNEQTRRFAREHPGLDTLASVAGIPATAGAPVAAAPMSALRAGATAAGVNAPFALARQEGNLQERLPGAALETGIAFSAGTALQGLANAVSRQAPQSGRIVANMERLGVRPTAAAATRNPLFRSLTRLGSENLVTGPRIRSALTESLEGTRDAASRLATQYGRPAAPEAAGERVRRAVQRYSTDRAAPSPQPGQPDPMRVSTRGWSLAAKAEAVFDHVLRPIARNPAQPNVTRQTLQGILGRADDPAVQAFREDPVLRQFVDTMDNVQSPTLRDLRKLRQDVRAAQDRPGLDGQTVDNAALQRIEAALTEDMLAAAGPAAPRLRQADEFYRRGRQRVQRAMEAIGGRNANAQDVFNGIMSAANKRTANTRAIADAMYALREDEWRDLAGSVIQHMGQPRSGASGIPADIGFSVHEFATAYRSMTPAARRLLFGNPARNQLARDLDDLAEIALRQKAIENMGTPSGRDVQNVVMGAGALANLPATAGGIFALGITGEMLTNPGFVRWLTSASRSGASVGGARQHLAVLARLASRDPALMPLYTDLAQRLGVSPENLQAQSQPRREPELQP